MTKKSKISYLPTFYKSIVYTGVVAPGILILLYTTFGPDIFCFHSSSPCAQGGQKEIGDFILYILAPVLVTPGVVFTIRNFYMIVTRQSSSILQKIGLLFLALIALVIACFATGWPYLTT